MRIEYPTWCTVVLPIALALFLAVFLGPMAWYVYLGGLSTDLRPLVVFIPTSALLVYVISQGLALFQHRKTTLDVDEIHGAITVSRKGNSSTYGPEEVTFEAVDWLSLLNVFHAQTGEKLAVFDYWFRDVPQVVAWATQHPTARCRRRRGRWLQWLAGVAILCSAFTATCWCAAATVGPQLDFVYELRLVSFSNTQLFRPSPEDERAAHEKAQELHVDLLRQYKVNLDNFARYDLAWMLVTRESIDYYELAKEDVPSIPRFEVRIWRARYYRSSLSAEYRERLLELLLASPTCEAKLFAGRWFKEHGRARESEDAYYAILRNGQSSDALTAAERLMGTARYHDAAVNHLFTVVRKSKHFSARAAYSLLKAYSMRQELAPLVRSCERERPGGPNRTALVKKLSELRERHGEASNGDAGE